MRYIKLLLLYAIELLMIPTILDIFGISEFNTTFIILLIIEVVILLYYFIFSMFSEYAGVEDKTAYIKINVGGLGAGKTYKAAREVIKNAKKTYLFFRLKKYTSNLLQKSIIFKFMDAFYDDEEQATIDYYDNIEFYYDKDNKLVDSIHSKDYDHTIIGWKKNYLIPLVYSNISLFYEKRINVKKKLFKQRVKFRCSKLESIDDLLVPGIETIENWDTLPDNVKIEWRKLYRNKFPYGSRIMWDEIGSEVSQYENKNTFNKNVTLRQLKIAQFEKFTRWQRHFGFMSWYTDQVTSDVFKGLRSRVSQIIQSVAQLPEGLPLIFKPFKIFWGLSLWRKLFYKVQANKDVDTSSEVVMVTRKEDLKPMRLVVSNVNYYYGRYYRTIYRKIDDPHDITVKPNIFREDYWTPKLAEKTD